MRPEQLPLVLASSRLAGPEETQPLDRIRMQKAVFLVEQRGPSEWRNLYQFVPYNWGPFSAQLQGDLGRLVGDGRLELTAWDRGSYNSYATSALGEGEAAEILDDLDASSQAFLREVRRFVVTRSFNRLLRDVYREYPEYAVKSHYSG